MNDRQLCGITCGFGGRTNVIPREDGFDITVASEIMAALLKDALKPNLVQIQEGTPVFIHGVPFAKITHGCNPIVVTRMAL